MKTQITLNHRIGRYRNSEQELFGGMLGDMKTGDLIICDRHFAGANLYVEYKRAGLEFITPTHQRLNIDKLKRIKEYSGGDLVVELPITPKHRRDDPSLPENIAVRLIEVKAKVRGKNKIFWLMTSLLDPQQYPANEIKNLYKKRWKVETLIEEIKIWLGSDVLRSKTAAGIRKELYARIVAGNLIHWLILKAAKKHKKEPDRISTTAATRLINCYTLKMSEAPVKKLNFLYEELLDKIAGSIIPYRPNRVEPRLKRRDQKHYSILHTSRAQWRKDNGIDP
ncbi:MAG: IS4 family transposase [Candidatus Omnitrophota bacterium]